MKMIKRKTAVTGLLIILSLIVVFHLLVVAQIIPHEVVWGGKFDHYASILPFEIVSIVLNVSFILLVRLRARRPESKSGRIGMLLMVVIFGLNTVGNLFAETMFEKAVFTPLTLIIALLSLRLALKGD